MIIVVGENSFCRSNREFVIAKLTCQPDVLLSETPPIWFRSFPGLHTGALPCRIRCL